MKKLWFFLRVIAVVILLICGISRISKSQYIHAAIDFVFAGCMGMYLIKEK